MKPTSRTEPRRGAIYVAVLGVTMIVAVMALASMSVSRLELRIATDDSNRHEAQLLARSGIEFGVHWIDRTANWRNDLNNDEEQASHAVGNGEFSWKVVDADGVLNDDENDTLTLYGYGRVGDVVAAESVVLQPSGDALTCLEAALHSGSGFTLSAGSFLSRHHVDTDQSVSANGAIDASANYAEIRGDAWATGPIVGDVTGTPTGNQLTPREMPDQAVFEYYKANGTWIDVDSLPMNGGFRTIDKQVLSPGFNPYGHANPEGIYVLDCQGDSFRIQNSRVVGTLVVLNPGASSRTWGVNLLEPAVPNYPVLMVDGDFRVATSSLAWVGESFQSTNYNPQHTPYPYDDPNGWDNDTGDTYPCEYQGLVYVAGQARVTDLDYPKLGGGMVCGSILAESGMIVNRDSVYYDTPPPGFRGGPEIEIVPGTWRRATAP